MKSIFSKLLPLKSAGEHRAFVLDSNTLIGSDTALHTDIAGREDNVSVRRRRRRTARGGARPPNADDLIKL